MCGYLGKRELFLFSRALRTMCTTPYCIGVKVSPSHRVAASPYKLGMRRKHPLWTVLIGRKCGLRCSFLLSAHKLLKALFFRGISDWLNVGTQNNIATFWTVPNKVPLPRILQTTRTTLSIINQFHQYWYFSQRFSVRHIFQYFPSKGQRHGAHNEGPRIQDLQP